jgi:hypothetical protein
MPTVLRKEGYRFFFFSNEHLPRHVHVAKGEGEARILLEPEIDIDNFFQFKTQELRRILEITLENHTYLIEKWDETFDQS